MIDRAPITLLLEFFTAELDHKFHNAWLDYCYMYCWNCTTSKHSHSKWRCCPHLSKENLSLSRAHPSEGFKMSAHYEELMALGCHQHSALRRDLFWVYFTLNAFIILMTLVPTIKGQFLLIDSLIVPTIKGQFLLIDRSLYVPNCTYKLL